MHVNLEKDPSKPPKYRCFRGTSQLEGFHKHLHALLPGFNTSPELADLLITLFVLRWNRKAAVKLGTEEYYGTMDYVLLEKVNDKYRELGMEEPYKSVAVRESGVQESFMFDWHELATGTLQDKAVCPTQLLILLLVFCRTESTSHLSSVGCRLAAKWLFTPLFCRCAYPARQGQQQRAGGVLRAGQGSDHAGGNVAGWQHHVRVVRQVLPRGHFGGGGAVGADAAVQGAWVVGQGTC